jgi:hypothetical protein
MAALDPFMSWMLFRYAKNALLVLVLLGGAVYAGDYLSVAIPPARGLFGTVQVHPYYAVRKKNKQIEFMFLDPRTEVCVHSVFPHFGNRPCWYAERRKERSGSASKGS